MPSIVYMIHRCTTTLEHMRNTSAHDGAYSKHTVLTREAASSHINPTCLTGLIPVHVQQQQHNNSQPASVPVHSNHVHRRNQHQTPPTNTTAKLQRTWPAQLLRVDTAKGSTEQLLQRREPHLGHQVRV